jgi:hypothetical protein
MGILYGTAGIPTDWSEYIGDDIITISIAKGCNGQKIPKTCSELSERVIAQAPIVVGAHSLRHTSWTYKDGKHTGYAGVKFCDETVAENAYEALYALAKKIGEVNSSLKPYSIFAENVMYTAQLTLSGAPDIAEGGEIGAHLLLKPKLYFENEQRSMQLRWILPEGFTAKGKLSLMSKGSTSHSNGDVEADYVIKAGDTVQPENRIVLEIIINGRCTPLYISFPLYG